MKIGFSGTRYGMTPEQIHGVGRRFDPACELHHGDCDGADDEADALAVLHGMAIVVHAPIDEKHRAFCDRKRPYGKRTVRPPKTHFARNRDIVDETDELIATPFDKIDPGRGGTWYTINYAVKRGKPVTIIHRDGSVETR